MVYAGPWVTVANLLLVQGWIPIGTYFFSYNAVSWSISTELAFYLLFPLLLRLHWSLKLVVPAALVIGAISLCLILNLPGYDGRNVVSSFGVLYPNPLTRLLEFSLGMCCALLWTRLRPSLGDSVLGWTIAEAAAVLAIIWFTISGRSVVHSLTSAAPVSLEYLGQASYAPLFAFLIFVLAGERGIVARLLATRPMVFLGEISFALYMTHTIFIGAYVRQASQLQLSFPTFSPLLLLAAACIHLFIEKPARTAIINQNVRRRREGQLLVSPRKQI